MTQKATPNASIQVYKAYEPNTFRTQKLAIYVCISRQYEISMAKLLRVLY